jgi:drug/metabolite transporter (DMT)-like permease
MSAGTVPQQNETAATAARPRRRFLVAWQVRFAALSLIWGFSFLLIKVGNQAFAPLQVTLGRVAFGAVILFAVIALRRDSLPKSVRTWVHLGVAGFFLNALPFALFSYAELTIPSWLAGVCNATSPLWGMVLAVAALSEDRPTRRRVAGLGIGFLGVLTVLGAWQGFAGIDPVGVLLALGAALSFPVGWVYVRRTLAGGKESNLVVAGTQMLLGAVELAVVTVAVTTVPVSFPLMPVLSVVALGVLGTGVAFLIQFGLVAEVGPTIAMMVTYFIPVVAIAAGVIVLDETLSWYTPVGTLIILFGAALTQPKAATGSRKS